MSKKVSEIKKGAIDWFVAMRVKARREELGMSQPTLADLLRKDPSFIGHIESPNQPAKYNIRHLNEIAKVLNCSPKDFMPEKPI